MKIYTEKLHDLKSVSMDEFAETFNLNDFSTGDEIVSPEGKRLLFTTVSNIASNFGEFSNELPNEDVICLVDEDGNAAPLVAYTAYTNKKVYVTLSVDIEDTFFGYADDIGSGLYQAALNLDSLVNCKSCFECNDCTSCISCFRCFKCYDCEYLSKVYGYVNNEKVTVKNSESHDDDDDIDSEEFGDTDWEELEEEVEQNSTNIAKQIFEKQGFKIEDLYFYNDGGVTLSVEAELNGNPFNFEGYLYKDGILEDDLDDYYNDEDELNEEGKYIYNTFKQVAKELSKQNNNIFDIYVY